MNLFRNIGIAGIFIAATGCAIPTAAKRVGEFAEKLNTLADRVDTLAEKIDTNNDGKVDPSELYKWLLGGSGAAGLVGLLLRNKKSDQLKENMRREISDLNRRLPPTV